jgi:hypothetical protein
MMMTTMMVVILCVSGEDCSVKEKDMKDDDFMDNEEDIASCKIQLTEGRGKEGHS